MKLITILLMMGMTAWGQNPTIAPLKPAPNVRALGGVLKCGKYQRVDYPSQWCADSMPNSCYDPHCADDMHEVTEREWQAMVDSIRILTKLNDIHEARLRTLEQHQQDTKEFIRGVIDGASRKAKP